MSGNETRKNHTDEDKTIAPRGAASENHAGTSPPANDAPTIMGSQTVAPGDARARAATIGRVSIEGYEIIEELGRGGMGVVYKARDVELNRIVAIKMILAGVHAGEESLARFRTEAEAVAQLKHPGIVQVYDVGQADGQPFCALEYVEGGSLDQLIRDEPMPVRDAVALVESLAHAMQSAHQAGIVHRDLKPPNILLARQAGSSSEAGKSPGWTAKITDFGLAKKVEQESQQTQTGAVMGTPSYMAPEQARGVKRIGPSADVYSLGAILYELITGQPPFSEDTPINTIMRVMADPPPAPRSINPAIDRDLDTICLKCLEKEPAARYVSAEHLAQDLERYQDGMPIEARPVSGIERTVKWVRRKPLAASLIGVSTLGLIALIVGGAIFNAKLSAAYQQVDLQYDKTIAALEQTRLAKDSAEASDAESLRRLINNYVNNALQAMNQNNMLGALPWLAEAIALEKDPVRQEMHQLRFGYALASSPQPHRTWVIGSHFDGCQFSEDGKLVAAFSVDRRVRIWNIKENRLVREIETPGPLLSFMLGADSTSMLTASVAVNMANIGGEIQTAEIALWDLTTGDRVGQSARVRFDSDTDLRHFVSVDSQLVLRPPSDVNESLELLDLMTGETARSIALQPGDQASWLAPSGRYCVVSGDQPRIVNVADGHVIYPDSVTTPAASPQSIALDPGGLAIALYEDEIEIYSPEEASSVVRLPRSQDKPSPIIVAAPQSAFAVAWPDHVLEQFDGSGKLIDSRRIDAGIVDLQFSGDGQQLFAATRSAVLPFDTATGKLSGSPIPATIPPLRSIDITGDNRYLAIAGGAGILQGSGFVRVWDISPSPNRIQLLPDGDESRLRWVFPSPQKTHVAALRRGGKSVQILANQQHDIDEQTVLDVRPVGEEDSPVAFATWKSDSQICVGLDNGQVSIVQVPDNSVMATFRVEQPAGAVFSDDGSLVAIGGGENASQASVIDWSSGETLCEGLSHKRRIMWMSFDPAGELLYTMSRDFNIRVFDVATGEQLQRHNTSLIPLGSAWHADTHVLYVVGQRLGGMPGRLTTLDMKTGKPAFDPVEFNHPVEEVAVASDGQMLAVADNNGTVQLHDAATGKPVGIPMVHPDSVTTMAFSEDGNVLMTLCQDLRIRMFDVTTCSPVTAPMTHQSDIGNAAFRGMGYDIVSSGDGGLVWKVPLRGFTAAEAAGLSRYWSGAMISERGAVVPVTSDALSAIAVPASLNHDEPSN